MANNCLQTKLKASIDNKNLQELGSLRIDSHSEDYTVVLQTSKAGSKVTSVDKPFPGSQGYVQELTNAGQDYSLNIQYDSRVDIQNKYNLYKLNNPSIAIKVKAEDFNYMDDITTFSAILDGDLSVINRVRSAIYNFSSRIEYNGPMKPFFDMIKTARMVAIYPNGLGFSINVSTDLANMTQLETLYLNYNNNVSGTIEEFVISQVNKGRTTASNLAIQSNKSSITFNGSSIGSSAGTLSWAPYSGDASKTDITFKGVTVTVDNS